MLPVFASTRPSKAVPTSRFTSSPGWPGRARPRSVRERVGRARGPALDRDALALEREGEGPGGVEVGIGQRHAHRPGRAPQRDAAHRPYVPGAGRAVEVVFDRRVRVRGPGAGAVLEADQPEVG